MRHAAAGALGALCAALLLAAPAVAEPITVTASAIPAFEPNMPETTRFGALRFIGGLELDSSNSHFGGLSGIQVGPDGETLLMVSDLGSLFHARLTESEGRPTGLADVELWPLGDRNGHTLGGKYGSDAESLRSAPGAGLDRVLVGFERDNRVIEYAVDGHGRPTFGHTLDVPPGVRKLPHNLGLEAIAVAPPGSPNAGTTALIAETPDEAGRLHGWILDGEGRTQGTIEFTASDDFSATDAVFLDTGDLILLERRFQPLTGLAMRLRRFPAARVKPGAVLDGEELFTGRMNYVVDNMEGLAFHRDGEGRAILTLVSDDNFNILQRTLLLRFELVE